MSQIANVLHPMLANPSPNHRADNHSELIVALLHKKVLFNSLHSRVHFCAIYFYIYVWSGEKKLAEIAWEDLSPEKGMKSLLRVAEC